MINPAFLTRLCQFRIEDAPLFGGTSILLGFVLAYFKVQACSGFSHY